MLVLLVSSNAIGQDINPNGWDHAVFTHPYHNQNTGNYILVGDGAGRHHVWCSTDRVSFDRGGQVSAHRIWNDRGGDAILNLHGGTDWAITPGSYIIVDEASRASFASNMDNTRGYFLAPENDPNTPRTLDPCFVWPAWPAPQASGYLYLSSGPVTEEQEQVGDYNQRRRTRDVVYTHVSDERRWFGDTGNGDTVGVGRSFATYAEAAAEAQIIANEGRAQRQSGSQAWVSFQIGVTYDATVDGTVTRGTVWQSTNGYPSASDGPAIFNANNGG